MNKAKISDRKFNLKTIISVAIVAILLSAVVTYQLVYSNPVSPAVYLDDLPSQATYTIKKDASNNYWAVARSGDIAYEDTDAAAVINNALSSAGSSGGGTVFLTSGTYTLTDSITITQSYVWFIGESRDSTIITSSLDIDLIKVYPSISYISDIKIANVWLRGKGADCTSMGLNVTGQVYYSQFEAISATLNYDGLHFQATYETRGYRHILSCIHAASNLRCGLYFQQQDAINLYKIDSSGNVYGLFIEELCQGIVIESARCDQNTSENMCIKGSQVIRVFHGIFSDAGGHGLVIDAASTDIAVESCYFESSADTQIFITQTSAYSNYDIRITNCRIVRGEKNGITISGAYNRNNTNIRIEGNTIINNGQATNDTYYGIEAYGSGANATSYVYINNNYIGNDSEEPGEIRQRGIRSNDDSDYFMVCHNDVSTALWTAAITEQIILAGGNNIQEDNFGDA